MSHTDWTEPTDWTVPEGWVCSSYGNDTCPSWTAPDGTIVFVEYPEGERECAGTSQYTVYADYCNADKALFECDSYTELTAYLTL
jgi:hypothetical protein